MKRQYTILPEPLHEVADLSIEYFIKQRGVPASSIKVEQSIGDEVPYRPTFTGRTGQSMRSCIRRDRKYF